ncbi:MAG: lysophospholipid acyltransferase family protein [Betaproteobacteria bacterium]
MSALRSVLFMLYQLVVTPSWAVLVLLLFWLPPIPRFKFIMGWCWLNLFGARWICGIHCRVIGRENLPPFDQPHVVMCKHSSTWETLALNFVCPPLAFVAKKELLSIPFFGWAFRCASPITIDRTSGQSAMTQIATQGRERLAQGFWIVVYPEGTRIRTGTRAHYKTGGARLALMLGVPILPVAHNAGYLWPKGMLGKLPGTVTMSIGAPIASDGKDMQRLMNEVESWIENEVVRLGDPRRASGRERA